MKISNSVLLLTLLPTAVLGSKTEHIERMLQNVSDQELRRHLASRPYHMLHKAAKHMAADKEVYKQAFVQDITAFNQGNRFVKCPANGAVNCHNIDIETYIYNEELGCNSQELIGFTYINDLWGWTDPETNKEYALVGMFDGTSIVDITKPKKPEVLGFIDTTGDLPPGDFSGFWRDIKVVNNVAYIGAEVAGHGMQVFDLTRLRDVPSPSVEIFKGKNADKIPLAGDVPRILPDKVIDTIGSSHNIVQFPEVNKILAVGLAGDATACDISKQESVAIWDVSDPLNPVFETCLSGAYNFCGESDGPPFCSYSGYVHDGQCFIYTGPDQDYSNVPMCVFFAETEVVLFNMEAFDVINVFTWPDAAYVHQGWFSEDFTLLFGNDELDELEDTTQNGQFPRTRIIDMSDLDDPQPPIALFDNTSPHPSIDHNLYVKEGYIFSANYEAGSRIYEIVDTHLEEVAFFDITSVCDDIENCADPFGGSWTHFPYFDSGSSIGCNGFEGFYVFSYKLN